MTFEPEFTSEMARQQAIDVCGTAESCLFDVASTKDMSAGMEAAASVSSFETEKASLSKYYRLTFIICLKLIEKVWRTE